MIRSKVTIPNTARANRDAITMKCSDSPSGPRSELARAIRPPATAVIIPMNQLTRVSPSARSSKTFPPSNDSLPAIAPLRRLLMQLRHGCLSSLFLLEANISNGWKPLRPLAKRPTPRSFWFRVQTGRTPGSGAHHRLSVAIFVDLATRMPNSWDRKLAERKLCAWLVFGRGRRAFNPASVLPDNRPAHVLQTPRQFFLCQTEAYAQIFG